MHKNTKLNQFSSILKGANFRVLHLVGGLYDKQEYAITQSTFLSYTKLEGKSHSHIQLWPKAPLSQNHPNYKSTSTKTIIEVINLSYMRDFKPTNIQAKIVVIQHNKSHVTYILQVFRIHRSSKRLL